MEDGDQTPDGDGKVPVDEEEAKRTKEEAARVKEEAARVKKKLKNYNRQSLFFSFIEILTDKFTSNIERVPEMMKPMMRILKEKTGMVSLIMLVGPEPQNGGELLTVM